MSELKYITLRENPELKDAAASWFNSKWGVPNLFEKEQEKRLCRCQRGRASDFVRTSRGGTT